jgi:hypothetical protein
MPVNETQTTIKMAAAGAAVFPFTAFAQSTEFTFYSSLAKSWLDEGRYFSWTSTTEFNHNQENGTRGNFIKAGIVLKQRLFYYLLRIVL